MQVPFSISGIAEADGNCCPGSEVHAFFHDPAEAEKFRKKGRNVLQLFVIILSNKYKGDTDEVCDFSCERV